MQTLTLKEALSLVGQVILISSIIGLFFRILLNGGGH